MSENFWIEVLQETNDLGIICPQGKLYTKSVPILILADNDFFIYFFQLRMVTFLRIFVLWDCS